MKQIFLRFCVGFVLVLGLFLVSQSALAMTPTLSVSATGSSDSVTVTVYGDPNASVTLYQQNQGYNYNTQTQYPGTTNSSGYLSTTVNTNNYGITSGSSVYVMVNNQISSSVVWPYNSYSNYNYGNCYGSLSLSQTNVSVNVGQSVDVTINGGNAPYTMYPVGANIFQAVIGGNRLQIVGLNNGSGSVNVCSSGGVGSGCVVLSVTVNSSYYGGTNYYNPPVYNNQAITFSQNNPALSVGQSMSISISGGNVSGYYYINNYYIGHNSNSSVLSASVNGNTLNLQGLANGNTAVVVCSSSTNCSAINITVGGSVSPADNWTFCGNENQFCSFSGTRNVRYGANGVYVYRTLTNGVNCSNAVFGDPVFGVAKRCSISGY